MTSNAPPPRRRWSDASLRSSCGAGGGDDPFDRPASIPPYFHHVASYDDAAAGTSAAAAGAAGAVEGAIMDSPLARRPSAVGPALKGAPPSATGAMVPTPTFASANPATGASPPRSANPAVAPPPPPPPPPPPRLASTTRSDSTASSGLDLPDVPDAVMSSNATPALDASSLALRRLSLTLPTASAEAARTPTPLLDLRSKRIVGAAARPPEVFDTSADPNIVRAAFDTAVADAQNAVSQRPDAEIFSLSSMVVNAQADSLPPAFVVQQQKTDFGTQTGAAPLHRPFNSDQAASPARDLSDRSRLSSAPRDRSSVHGLGEDNASIRRGAKIRTILTPLACVPAARAEAVTERREHYTLELSRFYHAQFAQRHVQQLAVEEEAFAPLMNEVPNVVLDGMLGRIPRILDSFQGHEEDLFRLLRHKYSAPEYVFAHFDGSLSRKS